VTAVTPQSISQLLARNADTGEPKPKIPQVQLDKEKLIPEPEKKTKKVQTVKRTSAETKDKAAPGEKGDAKAKGPSLPEGVQTDQYVDSEYLVTIVRIIHSNWRFPSVTNPNIRAVVFFEIGRDGRILRGIRVEKRSGHLGFDKSAFDAIMASNPFPRLPDNFSGEKLGIHLAFTY
jgi:outer membrane biosynthesis protein TonB